MASLIRGRYRGGSGDGADGIARHTVGNALVLHAHDEISSEAQSLALSVVQDAENDVVVLDIGGGMPITMWESMAGALPKKRRGIRLVACGQQQAAAAMAGQWLSERLNRTVIAPDGFLVRGAAGALFVHSTPGSGWVRFRPGRPPMWDAKRYPRPVWDTAAIDSKASSSTGEIEPLPGGVWLHDTRQPELIEQHREQLIARVPCLNDTMTVLLGCPGTAPLSLDDVVRFWRDLDDDSRSRARFVHYGDVRLPEGEAFGQALAELLGTHIVCYTGVPIGTPARMEIHTVRPDGLLGWPAFATELRYAPRAHPNSKALPPQVLNHRAPLKRGEQIAPRVYWYAPDAVVEVVQSGLWVRSPEEPVNADRVRATPLDPQHNTLVFDDTIDVNTARMRELAEDLVARLDRATAAGSILVPASILAPGVRAAGVAKAYLPTETPPSSSTEAADAAKAPEAAGAPQAIREAPPQVMAPMTFEVAPIVPVATRSAPVEAPAGEPEKIPARPLESNSVETTVMSRSALLRGALSVMPPSPTPSAPPPSAPPAIVTPAPPLPAPPAIVKPPLPAPPTVVPPPPVPPRPVLLTPLPPPPPLPPPSAVTQVPSVSVPVPPVVKKAAKPAAPGVRLQPVPAPGASALLSGRGLTEERAWLRKTLSRDFDAMASSASRILSEHPGMQGGDGNDVLSDAVAIRLYLSQRGAAIDAGLRSAANGPHVPFARCTVSGLSRLPSHRGPTVFTMTPTRSQWRLYAERKMVTEWGFIHALTGPCSTQDGDVDVLIWSMTARRTALLEPDGAEHTDDRVLFLPGTSFKILDMREPAPGEKRGLILMREIGANEIDDDGRVDPNRMSLDDLAVTSLLGKAEKWADAEPVARIGTGSAPRFGALPGLLGE